MRVEGMKEGEPWRALDCTDRHVVRATNELVEVDVVKDVHVAGGLSAHGEEVPDLVVGKRLKNDERLAGAQEMQPGISASLDQLHEGLADSPVSRVLRHLIELATRHWRAVPCDRLGAV